MSPSVALQSRNASSGAEHGAADLFHTGNHLDGYRIEIIGRS